ncbi:glutathione S-transferase family protein [Aliiroseovarius sp.]|uniref:glutathione S-transferase family protein n=1 Tax=Aliiroseovarius sp. TaxID=1872442 RepID=UPI003BAA6480
MYRLHYAPDNASLIVRLVLEELGQPYETILVDRSVSAQHSAAYLKVNPMGMIPALETPDGPIFETAAILLWLADRHGRMAPAPNVPERAAFLSWLFACANGLHTDLRQLFYPHLYAGENGAGHASLTRARITRSLDRLEALAASGQPWFCAESPTILDLYVAVMLRWPALYPAEDCAWYDLGRWPRLHALATRLETRASMATAQAAEGLGPTPLTAPSYPQPPEGSAL